MSFLSTHLRSVSKRQAPEEEVAFGWFHIRTCLVAGIGFFTDAYDVFIISLVTQMIGYVYFADPINRNIVPPTIDMGIKVSAAIGTFIGQLLFGHLADRFGRKKIYGTELLIIITCTVGSAFAADTHRGIPVWGVLIFWRVFLGVGIGGDYPVSAVITSEFATTSRRGAMISAVFSMQGFGILAGALVATGVLRVFREVIEADILILDQVWRILIALGLLPALISLYYRLVMPETPRYQREEAEKAEGREMLSTGSSFSTSVPPIKADNSWSAFVAHFGQWRHGKVLLGTSMCWFALDVAFYGINLNTAVILQIIGYASTGTAYDQLLATASGSIMIALLGAVPGYWVSVFTIDRLGRKAIQLMGFAALTVLFAVLGAVYEPILASSTKLFVVLFTLANFFQNFGPNVTTFVLPGEVFPTRFRSTAHGISAASGKLGAILAQVGFSQLKDIGGKGAFMDKLLLIFAAFMLTGLVFTFLVPETKGRSLEEISGEREFTSVGEV